MGADACAQFAAEPDVAKQAAGMSAMCTEVKGVETACSSCGAPGDWSTCEKYDCLLGSSTCAEAFGAYVKTVLEVKGDQESLTVVQNLNDKEAATMALLQKQSNECPEFAAEMEAAQMKVFVECMECMQPPSSAETEENSGSLECTEGMRSQMQCYKDNAKCSTAIAEAPESVRVMMTVGMGVCEEQDDDDAADDDDDAANAHCYAVAGAVSALTAAVL
jgi:hypothetical protein